jgi:hypothetical protein
MFYVESADARAALMTIYLLRYPPAGRNHQHNSPKRHSPVLRVKNPNVPCKERRRRDRSTMSPGKGSLFTNVQQIKVNQVLPVERRPAGNKGGIGRTIYDKGSTLMSPPTIMWERRGRTGAFREACAVDFSAQIFPALEKAGDTEEYGEGPDWDMLMGRREDRLLLMAPPLRTDFQYRPETPELSPVDSDGTTDSDMSWEEILSTTIDGLVADNMFNMFINVDECAEL